MNNEYERILLTCIYDKKKKMVVEVLREHLYTIDEYNEKFENFNRKSGICE